MLQWRHKRRHSLWRQKIIFINNHISHNILVAFFWIFSLGFFLFMFQVHGLKKRLMIDTLFFLSKPSDWSTVGPVSMLAISSTWKVVTFPRRNKLLLSLSGFSLYTVNLKFHTNKNKLEQLLNRQGWRMTPVPVLQIYLWPRETRPLTSWPQS